MLDKRPELLKARQKNGSALILVENGSISLLLRNNKDCKGCKFRFTKIKNFVFSHAQNFQKRQKVVHKQWCKKYSKSVIT